MTFIYIGLSTAVAFSSTTDHSKIAKIKKINWRRLARWFQRRRRTDGRHESIKSINSTHIIRIADEGDGDASKRRRLAENEASRPQLAHHDLNFPLPGEKGPACLVKVSHYCQNTRILDIYIRQMYGEVSDYKVNEMLEVYGILSVDPVLAQLAR